MLEYRHSLWIQKQEQAFVRRDGHLMERAQVEVGNAKVVAKDVISILGSSVDG